MKIFISGSNGFTGKYLKKVLIEKGYDVFCGSLRCNDPNEYYFNLLDIDSMNSAFKTIGKIDFFIHLAATSFTLASDYEIELNNKIGVKNLMRVLCKFYPNYNIFSSSASVYGNAKGALSEKSSLNPTTTYAKSKLFLEQEVLISGLKSIVVRPFNYTGIFQNDNFLIPKLIKNFKEKQDLIRLGNLDIKREFNDVDDVVRIYSDFLNRADLFTEKGSVFNIGSGKAYRIGDIVDLLCEISGHKINVIRDEKLIRSNESQELRCNIEKLASIGIEPCSGNINSLLKKMLNN